MSFSWDVATVLTACGIETFYNARPDLISKSVATVLTVYGIETSSHFLITFSSLFGCNSTYRLRYWNDRIFIPFFVSISCNSTYRLRYWNFKLMIFLSFSESSCNSTYRLRYWNHPNDPCRWEQIRRCNSTYRLRYWNLLSSSACFPTCSAVATVLTVYGIETYKTKIASINTSKLQQYLPFTVLKHLYHDKYLL